MKRLLLICLVLLGACTRPDPTPAPVVATPGRTVALPDTLSGTSVYLLDAPWTDQAGASASLRQLLGRPVVLTFVYTHCAATCPLLVHHMKQIEQALAPEARAQTAFVLVSLDPARDTPAQIQKFAGAHGLGQPQWTILRGSPESVRALAASVSVGYRNLSDGQIAHANRFTILNQKGEVAGQMPGTGATDQAVRLLEELLTPPDKHQS